MDKLHERLDCWQRAVVFVTEIYRITASFPAGEKFGITSQVRRASVSIAANIAAGAARNTTKEFLQFLYIARGSLSEVDTLLTIASNLSLLAAQEHEALTMSLDAINRPLQGLVQKLRTQP